MWLPRFERFKTILARRARPGGCYPLFALARKPIGPDERDAMDALLKETELSAAWSVWKDPASSAAAKALAIAELDPAQASVHAALADISLRCDGDRVEPPEHLSRALSSAYLTLRSRLLDELDRDTESYATRRGLSYWLGEAGEIFRGPGEEECFARGAMAWGGSSRGQVPLTEVAEAMLVHTPDGAGAQLTPELFAALERPDELTSLSLWSRGVAVPMAKFGRAVNLRNLSLAGDHLTGAEETSSLGALPLETLALSLEAKSGFPAWVGTLPTLRTLNLRYPPASGREGAVLELPAVLEHLGRLESLTISGLRRLPEDLGRLEHLRTLDLGGWDFVGPPASLTALTRLEKLKIDPVTALPGPPEGFEHLTALRELRLGHLVTPGVPRALFRMPWLRRIELVSGADWPASEEEELRRAFPDAYVFVAFTGPVLRARAARAAARQ